MANSAGRKSLVTLAILTLLSVSAPATGAATPFLTTGLASSGTREATIGGYHGVLVNYTSSYSSSFSAFVYIYVVNSAGQTAYWSLGYCGFSANQKVACFVQLSSALPKGIYTVQAFATTTTGVAVSLTSSLQISV